MTKISVIIPTFNEVETLPILLHHLQTQGFHEIIVADASTLTQTSDDLKLSCGRFLYGLVRGRGAQMQAGAQRATGDVFFFLHADSVLPIGAHQAIEIALLDPKVVGGSFFLAFDRAHL